MSARFDAAWLDRLRDAVEIDLETQGPDGTPHRATVWITVDEAGRALVRSWRGRTARWYREATSGRPVALLAGGERLPIVAERATDEERIGACSAGLERKYAGDPAVASMVRDEVLDTTLELRRLA